MVKCSKIKQEINISVSEIFLIFLILWVERNTALLSLWLKFYEFLTVIGLFNFVQDGLVQTDLIYVR
jgi:hypothetical protein